jgi:hypothetical protein
MNELNTVLLFIPLAVALISVLVSIRCKAALWNCRGLKRSSIYC